MQVIPYAQPTAEPLQTKERRVLVACGIVLVAMGAVAAGIGASACLYAASQPASPSATLRNAAPALLLTMIVSGTLTCAGVGSVRMRRWSRAVVLSVSGVLLAFGAVTLPVMAVLHATAPPRQLITLQQAGGAGLRGTRPVAVDDGHIVMLAAALMAMCLAVPLFFFLVYRNRQLAAALEEAGRRRSWVDGRPLPAIALATALGMFAATVFLTMFVLPPIPFFAVSADASEARVILAGAMIVLSVFYAWAALLVFRLHPLGPWLALLLIGLTAGGSIAAMTNDALSDSFGPSGKYSLYELTWHLQLASVRGMFAVAAYAIPAALYVLYVRRILREMGAADAGAGAGDAS